MQTYLLDTDIVINFLRKEENAVEVFKKLERAAKKISVITLAEFLVGCAKSSKPKQQRKNFYQFLLVNKIKVHAINRKIAEDYAEIRSELEKKGQKLPNFDLLIAATALTYNFIFVTGNKKHFQRIKNLKIL